MVLLPGNQFGNQFAKNTWLLHFHYNETMYFWQIDYHLHGSVLHSVSGHFETLKKSRERKRWERGGTLLLETV